MIVYDSLIEETLQVLKPYECKELPVMDSVSWKCLKNNEFLLGKEVAFELGDRIDPCTVYNCVTSNPNLVVEDKIILLGKDLQEINENTNFSRITFLNVDAMEDADKAYKKIKRIEFERFNVIPQGYMVSTSSVENKENIRVSKKAIKKGLDFATIGNLFINNYKKVEGVNHAWMIFIVGDYEFIPELVKISRKVDDITNAFEHIMKNIILDCAVCPLRTICDDVEALRELHFNINKKKNTR